MLLLQGPVGPFFKTLANTLEGDGARVTHVCFNAADDFYSSKKHRLSYTQSDNKWLGWLEGLHQLRPVDLIILFGCERSRHVTAIEFGHERKIPVLCLEEGYVRPGFITAEINGNNRRSPLKDIDLGTLDVGSLTTPVAAPGNAFNNMAWYGFTYYVIRQIGLVLGRPAGNHHKQRKLIPEAFYWVRNVYRKQLRRAKNARLIDKLFVDLRRQYVIVPMQVRDDGQLLAAGRGWNNEKVIESLIPSFAKHAPDELHLVFKAHPLERGHTDADKRITQLASQHGVANRVFFMDDGSIGQVTKHAKAMVTINSTSALSAFHFNVPVAVLGDAMFRRDDLATCIDGTADLDRFWNDIRQPDTTLNERFMTALRSKSILSGDFYSRGNMKIASNEITKKCRRLLTP